MIYYLVKNKLIFKTDIGVKVKSHFIEIRNINIMINLIFYKVNKENKNVH